MTIFQVQKVTKKQLIDILCQATKKKFFCKKDEIRMDAAGVNTPYYGYSTSNFMNPNADRSINDCLCIDEYGEIEADWNGIVGFHKVNGTTVMIGMGCTDDALPVYAIVYIANNGKPRAYIPANGNTFDRTTNDAFEYDAYQKDPKNIGHIYKTANEKIMLADFASVSSIDGNSPIPMSSSLLEQEYNRWKNFSGINISMEEIDDSDDDDDELSYAGMNGKDTVIVFCDGNNSDTEENVDKYKPKDEFGISLMRMFM